MRTLNRNLAPIYLLKFKLFGCDRIQRFTTRAKTVEIAKKRLAERLAENGYDSAYEIVSKKTGFQIQLLKIQGVEKMSATISVRDQIKSKLAELELEAETLKATIPPAFKRFYKFRVTRPARTTVIVYSSDRETAEQKVRDRLCREYGEFELHPVVNEYSDVVQASLNSHVGSSIFDCLTESDAQEFLADFLENESVPSAGRKGRKRRLSGLERDVQDYQRRLRAERLDSLKQ